LPDLLGPGCAALDAQLAQHLADSHSGKKTDNLILDLLTRDERTLAWTKEFLRVGHAADFRRAYDPLPGVGRPLRAMKYQCPQNDYVWYTRSAASPVPECPTHHVALQLAPSTT
jgi:hypothetical protein